MDIRTFLILIFQEDMSVFTFFERLGYANVYEVILKRFPVSDIGIIMPSAYWQVHLKSSTDTLV